MVTELRSIFANVTCAKVQYFHGGIFKHQNKAVMINCFCPLFCISKPFELTKVVAEDKYNV